MAQGYIVREGLTEAQGAVKIELGADTALRWHEITVSIFNASGNPAADPITGTLSGSVQKRGADRMETFSQTLNLASGQRSWNPELSTAESYEFSVTGLNTDYTYTITILSWAY